MPELPTDEHLETILSLAFVAEFRDADTSGHLRRISRLARAVAARLGLPDPEVERIALAAPLHDIGKVAIPDEILLKPGALTAEERIVMQNHTVVGARLLADATTPVLQLGCQVCASHHERWDGRGYPDGLAGEAIPLVGRIVAVVDVYDALVTRRVYKPAQAPEEARATMASESGSHFDPACLQAFFAAEDEVAAIYAELGDDEEQWVI